MGKIRVLIVANLLIVIIVIVYVFLKFIGTPDFDGELKNLLIHALLALPAVLFWLSEFRYINSWVLVFYGVYVFVVWAVYIYAWTLASGPVAPGILLMMMILPLDAVVCLVILVSFLLQRKYLS